MVAVTMRSRRRNPRERSLVKFVATSSVRNGKKYPFKRDHTYLFLGELANMPRHCVVADLKTGRLFAGYHTDNFRELAEDET
jgi:hypothetical protein